MQRSVRSSFNHALEVAIHYANQLDVPLLVVYAIVTSYPGANERGFAFLFEGLHEAQTSLANRGIRLVVREAKVVGENSTGGAAATAVPLTIVDTCKKVKAPLLVMDRAYERLLRTWREDVCARVACPVLMVESDVVVPVDVVSPQPLSSAAALRRAHAPLLPQYLLPLPEGSLLHPSHALPTFSASAPSPLFPDELEMHDPLALLSSLADLDRSVPRVIFKRGGSTQAKLLLARFLRDRLRGYQAHRKEAAARHQSFLSPYLHFGHISPIYVALKVRQHSSSTPQDRRRFCDELLTWREMAVHFVYHHRESYDRYEGIPRWARESLEEAADQAEGGRRHAYSLTELEEGRTHDLLWNAAQEEMRVTGYMNNYMRMFW
jgi:deoxyribodipyrimidine photo-lyase